MKLTRWRKAAAALAATVLLSVGAVAVASPANAAVELTWDFLGSDGNYYYIELYLNGNVAGEATFSADPMGSSPGDSIMAFDATSDGWAVETKLQVGSETRIASTKGHNAPYHTPWVTGNLPEGQTYQMKGCVIGGSTTMCTPPDTVTS